MISEKTKGDDESQRESGIRDDNSTVERASRSSSKSLKTVRKGGV